MTTPGRVASKNSCVYQSINPSAWLSKSRDSLMELDDDTQSPNCSSEVITDTPSLSPITCSPASTAPVTTPPWAKSSRISASSRRSCGHPARTRMVKTRRPSICRT